MAHSAKNELVLSGYICTSLVMFGNVQMQVQIRHLSQILNLNGTVYIWCYCPIVVSITQIGPWELFTTRYGKMQNFDGISTV